LVKINKLSGAACSVYSIKVNGEEDTLLEKFIKENIDSFKSETKEIIQRLRTRGRFTGARPGGSLKNMKGNQVMAFVLYSMIKKVI